MAKRTASAKKQARAGGRRAIRNRRVRSEVKTLVVKARSAISANADAQAVGLEATRALDRAANKGILHRNNAARRKGRLMKKIAKLGVAVGAPDKPVKGKKTAPAKATAAKGAAKKTATKAEKPAKK
jgi:small subunit ribosomal protein S20